MRREDEEDGKDYYFTARHLFEADIRANKFVEHGIYEKDYYGTSLESIRNVVHSGKICVLNLHPQVSTLYIFFITQSISFQWTNAFPIVPKKRVEGNKRKHYISIYYTSQSPDIGPKCDIFLPVIGVNDLYNVIGF